MSYNYIVFIFLFFINISFNTNTMNSEKIDFSKKRGWFDWLSGSKNFPEKEAIKGIVYIDDRSNLIKRANQEEAKQLSKLLNCTVKNNDLLIHVVAREEENVPQMCYYNWHSHGYKKFNIDELEFPSWLPLKLFKDKKENDHIKITINKRPITLDCKQTKSPFYQLKFEEKLKYQMNEFIMQDEELYKEAVKTCLKKIKAKHENTPTYQELLEELEGETIIEMTILTREIDGYTKHWIKNWKSLSIDKLTNLLALCRFSSHY